MSSSDNAPDTLRLPKLIGDGMVLQRDIQLRIWGWAVPGARVKVTFLNKNYECRADEAGKWLVILPAMEAGGPYEMEIEADRTITVKNILIGDVWVCAGQSNMQLTMDRVKEKYAEDIKNCENPFIRLFTVPMRYDFNSGQDDYDAGEWKPANRDTILEFTAAGYFFAAELYKRYKVPVGLVATAIGGTPVEAWLSREELDRYPEIAQAADKCKDKDYIESVIKQNEKAMADWFSALDKSDLGLAGNIPWYDNGFEASDWGLLPVPSYWADEGAGMINGVVWFRKEIDIPESMTGKPSKIYMGRIVDADWVYINGSLVGSTSYQYPPRIYEIPDNLLRPGKNTITVRVVSLFGKGGFVNDKPYMLVSGSQSIDLKGMWRYKIGAVSGPLPEQVFIQNNPTGFYNGMIVPMLNFRIKGVIWYQGESNTHDPSNYYELFSTLIRSWRRKWAQGDFPFLFVQLPNYRELDLPTPDSNWAYLREAQLKSLDVPATAMAITIDLGEWNDLHPLDKKNVGLRLALAARSVAYGEKSLVYSGPLIKAANFEKGRVVLSFDHAESGLMSKGGGEIRGFEISGKDGKFIPASAVTEGGRVVVWSEQVPEPAAVRYAWADDPEADLCNAEGLPASPFRISKQD